MNLGDNETNFTFQEWCEARVLKGYLFVEKCRRKWKLFYYHSYGSGGV